MQEYFQGNNLTVLDNVETINSGVIYETKLLFINENMSCILKCS